MTGKSGGVRQVAPGSSEDQFPVGYRFTMPHFGRCEITACREQTADEFVRDITPPVDYLVRCGPDRIKKMMTHEFITCAMGVREGWTQ